MYYKQNTVIAIIDSGIGGISVLKQMLKKYNCGNYIYFADNLYMPYGSKSKSFVKKRVEGIIELLIANYKADYVIIACNTASSCIDLNKYKNVYTMNFNKDLFYLTTPLTKANVNLNTMITDKNLAKDIENYIFDQPVKLKKVVKEVVKKNNLNELQNLCLGCTHYELVHNMFEEYCPNTEIIDNSKGILNNIKVKKSNDFNVIFLSSMQSYKYQEKLRTLTFD